ncbi:vacuolar protein sorting-associated protein 1 [Tulasnella sp. JGI-2019a]|nr:vacuolar protein sorting-associated protein 1 [Tulasnella sp. JGI-2019a]KAG9017337.1 vacuolar protein sorting-associated protein 1 [Tulasnella sp. JGI-2019a]KAG9034072.1 vacuolar protein sorting-associated protein 1 [Tulasnella sp. JGI-2019a]
MSAAASGAAGLGVEIVQVVNRLQDAFNAVGTTASAIDLPQICVLGSQSSGKSSVLENIVGRDFLPRGSGIVTRRPLVLQLINRPATKPSTEVRSNVTNDEEWGEFLHLPGQKFHDFSKIRDEIVRDTELKTGKNAGISPLPINLRIFSPNVVTLTLVDLPGLTRVPVGDQPKDIERQIKDMLMKYVTRPNAIILAVTSANTDLANSDGLKMAREVDPEGVRTIGVLTKVDIMDRGQNVIDILAGRVIPLRLGYVPVVNRGQRDIEQNKSIVAALEAEKQFFETHEAYSSKAAYCGTPYLAKRLNLILMHHIKTTLPDIKAKIEEQKKQNQAELLSLGGGPGEDNAANIVLSAITFFDQEFRNAIDGTTNDLSVDQLDKGARIGFVFHELFSNAIKSIDPFDQVQDGDIRTILYNSSGSTPALFVGTAAFEVIIKQQIRRLEEPSQKCCQLIYDELTRILSQIVGKMPTLKRFPALERQFTAVIISFFRQAMIPTTKLVSDMVSMQASYLNTTNPDFLSGHAAMAMVSDRMAAARPKTPPHDPRSPRAAASVVNGGRDLGVDPPKDEGRFFGSFFQKKVAPNVKRNSVANEPSRSSSPNPAVAIMEQAPPSIRPQNAFTDREKMETEVIKLLITSYFNIIKRLIIDVIPKSISYSLVTYSKDNIQKELLKELYKPEVLDTLLQESEHVVNRRNEVRRMLTALTKAEEIVATV